MPTLSIAVAVKLLNATKPMVLKPLQLQATIIAKFTGNWKVLVSRVVVFKAVFTLILFPLKMYDTPPGIEDLK